MLNTRSALLAALTLIPSLPATSQTTEKYRETERVTVIDLQVEALSTHPTERHAGPAKMPPREELRVLLDGVERPIIALDHPSQVDEPWQITVYIDAELADRRDLRWSMEHLAAMAEDLTRLGVVDLIVADPEPRHRLRGIHDPALLESALAWRSYEEMATDLLGELRSAFLVELETEGSSSTAAELAESFGDEEIRLVQDQLDRLSTFLAEQTETGRRRVLLLVGCRYDAAPASFYSSWQRAEEAENGEVPAAGPSASSHLRLATESLARDLAAYGWITFPLLAPERASPLVPGLRLGKWRLAGPAGGKILGLRFSRESDRDPEKAEGYLDIGEELLHDGQPARAEEAFRRSLHHFYGDPRTADLQARAFVGLGDALEAQGRSTEARTAWAQAVVLDPAVAGQRPGALAALMDPLTSLEVLAAATSGTVISDPQELRASLDGLGRRARLSIQLLGQPDGTLHEIAVTSSTPHTRCILPGWIRFGTPETVSAARARLLLSGQALQASADLDAKLERTESSSEDWDLQATLETATTPLAGELAEGGRVRVTLGLLPSRGPVRIEHRTLDAGTGRNRVTLTDQLKIDRSIEAVSLVVEHLPSGLWGAALLELM